MKKIFRIAFSISFLFYIIALVFLLFLDSRIYIRQDISLLNYIRESSNLVPFKTITTYIKALFDQSMNIDIPIKNLGGNLVMFLPLGIYLPQFINKLRGIGLFSILMVMLFFIIEVLQLITRTGSFDIDDFLLNMFGALIGFGIWKSKVVQRILK
ncbi:VanZ family protein [Ornithinibacillus massiliensis]|uniref:VanZ family protein n=1 Tax=Ornithinibacillus massiliensis TaxID=1944633 RepID=A0ABS5M8R5_9BACI|nr:VanZ family protein [Ornithinibacillus massiliensis]MBS3678696.1 VanZ family protein [Ornithinibacillus massiliensis]